ncbi:MAG: hypothetical protein JNM39_11135 [Bdellovibrionaceae bacterium]|nr:hypothetical protein [Pseudobdellovibrionaceae bacterium]
MDQVSVEVKNLSVKYNVAGGGLATRVLEINELRYAVHNSTHAASPKPKSRDKHGFGFDPELRFEIY